MKKSLLYFLGLELLLAVPTAIAAEQGVDVATPVFDSDAKKLAYCVCTYTQQGNDTKILSSEIWAANRNGSGARRLTTGSIDGDMRWSPDGQQIAFTRSGDIWIVKADGTGLKQITKTSPTDEAEPEFSNDGKTLFFVRTTYLNLTRFDPKAEELYSTESVGVVAYNLVSGQEKERFKGKDILLQVVPNRADGNEVFLRYAAYDAANPVTLEGAADIVVAAAKLDVAGRRILKTQKKDTKPKIKAIHAHSQGIVIETEDTNEDFDLVKRFLIQSKDGEKVFDGAELPLMVFNDISLDSNLMMGIGSVSKRVDGKLQLERSIRIYDVASKKTEGVSRSALLALAPAPVAAPPKPAPAPVVAKTNPEPPAAAKAHFEEGNKALQETLHGVAIDEYSQAIELYPAYIEAYRQRALAYQKREEFTPAIEDMDTVIRLAPEDVEAYLQRAGYFVAVGDNPAARADYDTAIRLAPQSANAYQARATFFRAIGDKQKAAEDEQKAKALAK